MTVFLEFVERNAGGGVDSTNDDPQPTSAALAARSCVDRSHATRHRVAVPLVQISVGAINEPGEPAVENF